jgi:hypothetical protein
MHETIHLSEEITLSNLPKTSGQSWDAIRNGPLNAQVSTKLDGVEYKEEGHSILGLHANAGITFDLNEIRKGTGTGTFKLNAKLGFGASLGAADSRADFFVYLDGSVALEAKGLKKSSTLPIDLSIPPTAQFLTLVATEGDDNIGSDLLFLGDARLYPEKQDNPLAENDKAELSRLQKEVVQLKSTINSLKAPPRVFGIVSENVPPVIKVHKRGNPEDEGQEVLPAGLRWSNHASPNFGDHATTDAARRQSLARWITHPDNPLTRRVIVNRLWHHHFGQGIVTTPSDFGLGGERPSHPELLDFLANELLKSGWSLKHIQRLIVHSNAYKQRSDLGNEIAQRMDSSNRLLWRQNPRRLDAETLRDNVLSTSGQINLSQGGPGFRDFKYTEAYAPIYEYTPTDAPEMARRSIYRFVVRTTPHQFLTTLDCPDPANMTPTRSQTTTALQALALSNNAFMLQQSRHMATRIQEETPDHKRQVESAFQRCFQRQPSTAEQKSAEQLVAEDGLFALCRMLLNSNEFTYLD